MRSYSVIAIPSQSAATVNSINISASYFFSFSVQFNAMGGGAAGSVKVQVSNDNASGISTVPTNWSDLPGASVSISGAGSYLIPRQESCYAWLRLVYTNSGGGTIQATVAALGT